MNLTRARLPQQVKPGAKCRKGDRFSIYIQLAAVLALSKGANKKEIATLLKCHPATLTNWQRNTPQEVLNWWKYRGRGETPRDCPGCYPGTALQGRRAAVCLLCNGLRYKDITEIAGIDRATLSRYIKDDSAGLCISKATASRLAIVDSLSTSVTAADLLRGKHTDK